VVESLGGRDLKEVFRSLEECLQRGRWTPVSFFIFFSLACDISNFAQLFAPAMTSCLSTDLKQGGQWTGTGTSKTVSQNKTLLFINLLYQIFLNNEGKLATSVPVSKW
jgi:hypothetical protein